MKTLSLFVVCFAFVVVNGRPESYTDEFDKIDVDEILSNPRLIDKYIHCIKTGQKCTPDGQRVRELLPDALQTKCSKCTEQQKSNAQKVFQWVIQNRPEVFLEMEEQYDPTHQYRKDYEDELKAHNVQLPPLN